ncbi:hypothetical protein PSI9734_01119 [Pseudidiomarina piscicola]|uniref:Uncharacterized protein n=1 Tax=Pseudidiomarina piscicola TaxID=2614830 RepID=A0A6S6WRB5_9GAMM|nr:hypothetical protein PSI9734_01119 [Pseudidiomarina piscicola]VZT40180.1 hypothetical protein PSI9734_01119 [Pseudomonas aeruginosa]
MPAGFPAGIPGIAEVIEGAMQHAPQPARQSTAYAMAIRSFLIALASS